MQRGLEGALSLCLRTGLARTTPTVLLLKLHHFPTGYRGCSWNDSIPPRLIFMLSGLFALTRDEVKWGHHLFMLCGLHFPLGLGRAEPDFPRSRSEHILPDCSPSFPEITLWDNP